jgi:branched-chain amino acid transport system ATP-binding protein
MNELSRHTSGADQDAEPAGESSGTGNSGADSILLELLDVRSGYGELEVIKGVSTAIIEGDLVCIIGNNGAGKSTLLKTIFGLLDLRGGRILYKGEDVSGESSIQLLKRGISMTPQGRCNFPEMSVRENLEIEAMMDKFPILGEKREQLAGNLSGGQQQILEMASALLLHPRLFLLDEPSLGLAPMIVSQVFEAIKDINRDGTTIIMVEQNAKQALTIADRALVLDLGRTMMEGPAQEIMENQRVRRLFLGG